MSDASPVSTAVGQLERARDELLADIAARQVDLGRVTAALELLQDQSARPASRTAPTHDPPASSVGRQPCRQDPVAPAPAVQKPGPTPRGPGAEQLADKILAWMRARPGNPLVPMSQIPDHDSSRATLKRAVASLVARGELEMVGKLSGARYRVAGVDGGRGTAEHTAVQPSPPAAPAQPTAAVSTSRPTVGENRRLSAQICDLLERQHQPLEIREIARSLVAPIGEVAQQLQIMVRQTEQGDRYPGVHRDAGSGYSLLARRAAA